MPTQKEDLSSSESNVKVCLDLWNLALILLGVTLVLILKPFWP